LLEFEFLLFLVHSRKKLSSSLFIYLFVCFFFFLFFSCLHINFPMVLGARPMTKTTNKSRTYFQWITVKYGISIFCKISVKLRFSFFWDLGKFGFLIFFQINRRESQLMKLLFFQIFGKQIKFKINFENWSLRDKSRKCEIRSKFKCFVA
jgi:hypothetical protein